MPAFSIRFVRSATELRVVHAASREEAEEKLVLSVEKDETSTVIDIEGVEELSDKAVGKFDETLETLQTTVWVLQLPVNYLPEVWETQELALQAAMGFLNQALKGDGPMELEAELSALMQNNELEKARCVWNQHRPRLRIVINSSVVRKYPQMQV